jgi:hypothetical protein
MNYEGDAFISYAHLDDVELIEGGKGWIANLHRALAVRVAQLLGKPPQIWRDPKLQGNDFFADHLVERLQRVATLIPVVSPRYLKSEWTRRELSEFWKAAEAQGGVNFRGKSRIFKVLKTPVPLESQSPELRSLLGYEFYRIDPDSGRIRELNEVFGPDAQREFWIRLDDLAHDICCLLEMMEEYQTGPITEASETDNVFLAETTYDLREQREAVKRDLQQQGYTVLPVCTLPPEVSELERIVRQDLERCRMSVHLVGKVYGQISPTGTESLVEAQHELAIERGQQGDFARLVWIPAGLEVSDPRQIELLERLRMDPRFQDGAELMESSLEDLKTVYQERLKSTELPADPPAAPTTAVATTEGVPLIYLMYDKEDSGIVSPWADFLFDQKIEVMRPSFEGNESEVREYHEENLRCCDGALILYGAACECWVRRKLRELQKIAGYGRTKPAPAVAIAKLPPRTSEKETFRTHEALMISQMEGFTRDPLLPFITRLRV